MNWSSDRSLVRCAIALGIGVGALVALPGCGGGEAANAGAKTPTNAAPGGEGGAANTGSAVPVPEQRSDLSGDAKSAYERGYRAWMAGDLAGAKTAWNEAAQKAPKSAAPRYSLGTVLERLGDTAGAQQEYRTAFSLQPDYEVAMGAYALSLANTGHVGEADTFLTDKRQRFPNSPRILTYLAEVKSIARDSGSAQQLAQDALRLNPDFKEAMVAIARDHYRARKLDLAAYALQAILEGFGDSTPPRDKDNAEARLLRGLIAKENGRRAAAMTDFEAARANRPDLYEATLNLGVMKLEAGNAREALPLLETAVRYAPNSALGRLSLGDAYRLLGETGRAKAELERALSLDSSLAAARYNLGLLYLFTPKVENMSADAQVSAAIRELEAYKQMRGPSKAATGQGDDIDELLSRARAKQAELRNAATAAAQQQAPAGGK
jgi:tetratricopeptide (TPR) repeat protein